ncbi:MAG: hypothetical protein E6Q85_00020 [Thiothrix sp.]|jgi:hypothetical protein|nr:MAG: hypothetical protein E6Q85_00020 [Thiothrix sp.]
MKRYLAIFLIIISFITNTNVMASALLATSNPMQPMQMTEAPADLTPLAESKAHCHQDSVTKDSISTSCAMGDACDNCFTHCGGALLSMAFSHFAVEPPLLVSIQQHYYTPTLSSVFLRPPQTV